MKVAINDPCPADWRGMSGDNKRRFCGQCKKHVHNLSEMTEAEAKRLLCAKKDLCVRYVAKEDGDVGFQASKTSTWFFVAAAMAAVGCEPVTETQPKEELPPVVMESLVNEEDLEMAWTPPEASCELTEADEPLQPVVVPPVSAKPTAAMVFLKAGGVPALGEQLIGSRRDPGIAGGMVVSPEMFEPMTGIVAQTRREPAVIEAEDTNKKRRSKKRMGRRK
jgi:hypothetical protein